MKKATNKELIAILESLAGFSLVGKAGSNGVKEKREELFCTLFSPLSGKGHAADEKAIVSLASQANIAIDKIKGELSPQVKQTLQRNIASACNLYLDTWNVSARVKITTKEITYTPDINEPNVAELAIYFPDSSGKEQLCASIPFEGDFTV